MSATTTPRLSIVVLPFANLSGDPRQDYLADVLTEGLTTGLLADQRHARDRAQHRFHLQGQAGGRLARDQAETSACS